MNLSCSADGFPAPNITWFFQGMNYTGTSLYNATSTFAESTAVLTGLMLTDGGIYSCEINSAAIDMARTSDVTITVIGGKTIYTIA